MALTDIVWQATITKEMVANLDEESLKGLIDTLDEAIEIIGSDWGVE